MQPAQSTSVFAAFACTLLLAACTADAPTADPPAAAPPAPEAAPPAPGTADTAPAVVAEPPVPDFVATGNEPFWSVRVTGDSLVYATPEDIDGQELSPAAREDGDGTVRYEGEAAGESFVLVLHEEPCQDSMSGWHHDFRSEFTWGERSLAGCGRRGSDPVGENPR